MSKIEKKYNKRFKEESFQDDGFDVEGLWDAIEPEIRKKKDRKIFVWILFGLILFGATSVFFFNKKSKTIEGSIAAEIVSSTSPNFQTNNVLEVDESTEKELKFNFENVGNSKTKSAKLKVDEVLPVGNNNSITKPKKVFVGFQNDNSSNVVIENLTSNNLDLFIEKEKIKKEINVRDEKELVEVFEISQLDVILFSLEENFSMPELKWVSPEKKKKPLMFGIYYGRNFQAESFVSNTNSTFAKQKNLTQKGFYGNTFGVQLKLPIYKNWIVGTGLEYNDLWSKFDYDIMNDVVVTKPNQLVKIQVNANGDTLNQIFRDTFTDALYERTVVHHNQKTQLAIPILLGFQKRHNKLLYGISFGGALNFQLDQKGKTLLFENEVLEYSSSTNQPVKNIGFSFRSSMTIGYYFSDKILFALEPTYSFSKNSFFGQSDLKSNNSIYNLNIGLVYNFGK